MGKGFQMCKTCRDDYKKPDSDECSDCNMISPKFKEYYNVR